MLLIYNLRVSSTFSASMKGVENQHASSNICAFFLQKKEHLRVPWPFHYINSTCSRITFYSSFFSIYTNFYSWTLGWEIGLHGNVDFRFFFLFFRTVKNSWKVIPRSFLPHNLVAIPDEKCDHHFTPKNYENLLSPSFNWVTVWNFRNFLLTYLIFREIILANLEYQNRPFHYFRATVLLELITHEVWLAEKILNFHTVKVQL